MKSFSNQTPPRGGETETDRQPQSDNPGAKEQQKAWKQVAEYSGLAMSLPIAAVLGFLGGQWIDGQLGTNFMALVGLLLGLTSGFVQLLTKALRDGRNR